ncbi:uncharacterized protein LOC132585805 [Heteronotia binoei]|uniref:uncharacterized protein LOC132585805 n=1 Tax=Heteronotia binoei TaxID=13085 RepID=UPI002931F67F|nr:uncharacterized protein LOC132585805 [Heteronotia binoei]
MDGLKFSALVCCFISIVLLVIVLTSSNWVEATEHAGLWKICNDTICNNFGMQMQGYIHATRALLIIGLVIGTVSFIDLCAMFGPAYLTTGCWTKFTSKAGFFAGLAVIAGLGTYTGGYFVSGMVAVTSLGWTYGLGWVPGPLFFVTVWHKEIPPESEEPDLKWETKKPSAIYQMLQRVTPCLPVQETIVITRSMLVTAAVCACASVFIISISFYQNRIYTFSLGRISSFTSFVANTPYLIVGVGPSLGRQTP